MGNLVKSELFKLRKNRSFWTLFFLLVGAAVLQPVLMIIDDGVKGIPVVSITELFSATAAGVNIDILRVIPCILAGFFISSEYSMGTMRSIGASGNSRTNLYHAKLITFSLGAMIISLIFPIVTTGVAAVLFSFNDMPALDYFARTMALTMLYTAALASIMSFFAIIFTDSGKTIGFSIIFFILIDTILEVLAGKFTLFERIYDYSVFKLFPDIGKLNFGNGEVATLVLVPILTYVVFGLLGSLVFMKKEIR